MVSWFAYVQTHPVIHIKMCSSLHVNYSSINLFKNLQKKKDTVLGIWGIAVTNLPGSYFLAEERENQHHRVSVSDMLTSPVTRLKV